MSTNELESKVRELRQLQSLIEEAQAEAEMIRDTIKAHMGMQEQCHLVKPIHYLRHFEPVRTPVTAQPLAAMPPYGCGVLFTSRNPHLSSPKENKGTDFSPV